MESLSVQLAGLPHPERMQRLMEVGRQVGSDDRTTAQLEALKNGDTFERWMAVKSCYTSRDGALVLASVNDPSRRIRGAARKLVALVCDDTQATEALKLVFASRQHNRMLMALYKRRRRAPIDAFLDWLREQPGETLFADVVPLGSPACIERHLGKALERAGFSFWGRMAAYAPAPLARLLQVQVQALAGHPDSRLRWVLDKHLEGLAVRVPDEVIPLWATLRERGVPVPWKVESVLLKKRPAAMVDAMLAVAAATGQALSRAAFSGVAHELDLARLRRLIEQDVALLGHPKDWLHRLPPAIRSEVAVLLVTRITHHPLFGFTLLPWLRDPAQRELAYEGWSYAARDRDGVIRIDQVKLLPADLSEREARRHLFDVTQLATRPAVRLPYAELLPWEDARAALLDHMGHPEGDVRGPAVATLLRAAGRNPARPELIDEALGMIKARKNEQDPVRAMMIAAALTWPRESWLPKHLASVGQIVRDGLDAADLSHGTAQALETLVLRVFRLDAAWGATWLTTLARERGRIHTARLGDLLSDDEVRASAATLLELAKGWAKTERDGFLMALCESLGARLPLVPGLGEVLESVLKSSGANGPAVAIMMLFFRHDRPRYERALPATLKRWQGHRYGEGYILSLARMVGEVSDLLADALALIAEEASTVSTAETALKLLQERRRERFLELGPRLLQRDASYILAPSLLWLAHRRRQDLLTPYLRGDVVRGRFATGNTSWVLPIVRGFERWSPAQHALYADTLNSVCVDRQRDTPTIFWAIYRLQELCYSDGAQLIALADDDRAAIQEGALRALSRLDAGQGVGKLLACMDDPRARIAIYALRKAILEMPPPTAAAVLQTIPLRKVTVAKEVVRLLGELRSEEAYQALLALARAPQHRDVRIALLRALWDHLEREPTWDILRAAALGDDWIMASRVGDIPPDRLSDRSERRLSELLAQVLDRPEPEARIDLLNRAHSLPIRDHDRHFYRGCLRRMESRYNDEIEAAVGAAVVRATERDVDALVAGVVEVSLHRKVLLRVMQRLAALSAGSSVAREATRRALELMSGDAVLAGLYAQIAPSVLSCDELIAALDRFAQRGWLDEFPLAAQAPIHVLAPAQLVEFEAALATRPHHALRLAALRSVELMASRQGWTPELRQRLATFQADPSPRVAVAAQFVFPPEENTPRPARQAPAPTA